MSEVSQTFCFMFEDEGPVWEKDMTRDQLLRVIKHLQAERDWWSAEAKLQHSTIDASAKSDIP